MSDVPERGKDPGYDLQDVAGTFAILGGGKGGTEKSVAIVLAALGSLYRSPDDRALQRLVTAAEACLAVRPLDHPFTPTRAEGIERLWEMLADYRKHGFGGQPPTNEQLALFLIDELHESRPGLPGLAAWYAEAITKEEKRVVAAGLRERIVAALDKADRRQAQSDWEETAVRHVLRALGDPQADNALKHRLKK